jgi:hypothetical protein
MVLWAAVSWYSHRIVDSSSEHDMREVLSWFGQQYHGILIEWLIPAANMT